MKTILFWGGVLALSLVACTGNNEQLIAQSVAETVAARPPVVQTVENTIIAEVPVTVEVEATVEVVTTVEVEVTRLVQEVVTATPTETPPATATPEPTATATPRPTTAPQAAPPATAAAEPAEVDLLTQLNETRRTMQSFGGLIDTALRDGIISCQEVVDQYILVAEAPTYDVGGWAAVEINAYNQYRAAVDVFSTGARDMYQNCADFLASPAPGNIPFQQWGLARQRVNDALEVLQPAIISLGGS